MRVVQQLDARGSLKWMQRAVADGWSDLNGPLLAGLSGATTIEWLSPSAEDQYAEYRDASFLRKLGLGHLSDDLSRFWPSRGPQWDGLALSDGGHVILAEAKAHIKEFCSPPSQAGEQSMARILEALRSTATSLGVADDDLAGWGSHFYQYTNRLAHLHWLRSKDVDAKLALIGFVHDDEMPGRTTKEAWQAAYLVAGHVLGLSAAHRLSAHIIHAHPAVDLRR